MKIFTFIFLLFAITIFKKIYSQNGTNPQNETDPYYYPFDLVKHEKPFEDVEIYIRFKVLIKNPSLLPIKIHKNTFVETNSSSYLTIKPYTRFFSFDRTKKPFSFQNLHFLNESLLGDIMRRYLDDYYLSHTGNATDNDHKRRSIVLDGFLFPLILNKSKTEIDTDFFICDMKREETSNVFHEDAIYCCGNSPGDSDCRYISTRSTTENARIFLNYLNYFH